MTKYKQAGTCLSSHPRNFTFENRLTSLPDRTHVKIQPTVISKVGCHLGEGGGGRENFEKGPDIHHKKYLYITVSDSDGLEIHIGNWHGLWWPALLKKRWHGRNINCTLQGRHLQICFLLIPIWSAWLQVSVNAHFLLENHVSCWNCAERITAKISFHQKPDFICLRLFGDWKDTVWLTCRDLQI